MACCLIGVAWTQSFLLFNPSQVSTTARVMVAKEEIGVMIGAIAGYHQCWCILHRRIGTSICVMQNTRGQLNLAKCLQSLPRYGYV
ncbi:unnamed protein product [Sphagnum balticum]